MEGQVSQLLCHLLGDYALQNHTMAIRKTSSWTWASVHVAFYMLPFPLLTWSPLALLVMAGTHLLIDRFRLAGYWTRFWGVGCTGRVPLLNPSDPPLEPAPTFLAVWLTIIVDNTAHLTINYLSLKYLS